MLSPCAKQAGKPVVVESADFGARFSSLTPDADGDVSGRRPSAGLADANDERSAVRGLDDTAMLLARGLRCARDNPKDRPQMSEISAVCGSNRRARGAPPDLLSCGRAA